MSAVTTASSFAGSLIKEISLQTIESGEFATATAIGLSPEETLAHLESQGVGWKVTKTGELFVSIWQLGISNFVSSEDVSKLRQDQALPKEMDALEWYSEHLPELRKTHPGQWIAIANGQLAATALTLPELLQKVKETGVKRPFISQIPAGPIIRDTAYVRENL